MPLPALVYPGFWRHPKLGRLSDSLGEPRLMCGGAVIALWGWCHEYAKNGDLTTFSNKEIAVAAEWPGDPDKFVAALRCCGWMDGSQVHNFVQRQGKKAIANAKSATRQSRKRERERDKNVTEALQKRDPVTLAVAVALPDPCTVPNGRGRTPKPEEPAGFTSFWEGWPKHFRKSDRAASLRAYKKHVEPDQEPAVMESLEAWKRSGEWAKNGGEFIPGPEVWLNKKKFLVQPPDAASYAARASPFATAQTRCELEVLKPEAKPVHAVAEMLDFFEGSQDA